MRDLRRLAIGLAVIAAIHASVAGSQGSGQDPDLRLVRFSEELGTFRLEPGESKVFTRGRIDAPFAFEIRCDDRHECHAQRLRVELFSDTTDTSTPLAIAEGTDFSVGVLGDGVRGAPGIRVTFSGAAGTAIGSVVFVKDRLPPPGSGD